ncbi:MAG: GNAT family N-acetyltransferase [Chloroflexota bacterium]
MKKKPPSIRLLTQQDFDIVRAYLNKDPLHNIYAIHALEIHGLESEYATFGGAFGGKGRLEGILFADNDWKPRLGCLVGDDPRVLARLGEFALGVGVKSWIGKRAYIEPGMRKLNSRFRMNIKRFHFFEIHPGQFVRYDDYPVRAATEYDIPLLVELYRGYEFRNEFRTDKDIEHEIKRGMNGTGGYFLVEFEGRVVSAARVAPETDLAGMIGAARTLPEYRGRGMYPSVRTACLEYLFKRGKIGLSYILDNDAAMGRVIEKFGFPPTDTWLAVDFRERPPLRQRILPVRIRRWGARVKQSILRQ